MHPAELLEPNGGIDPRRHSPTPGIVWLHRIADHFDARGLDQPRADARWDGCQTTRIIRQLFPMFHLSVDGLADAVQALVGARVSRTRDTPGSLALGREARARERESRCC